MARRRFIAQKQKVKVGVNLTTVDTLNNALLTSKTLLDKKNDDFDYELVKAIILASKENVKINARQHSQMHSKFVSYLAVENDVLTEDLKLAIQIIFSNKFPTVFAIPNGRNCCTYFEL